MVEENLYSTIVMLGRRLNEAREAFYKLDTEEQIRQVKVHTNFMRLKERVKDNEF